MKETTNTKRDVYAIVTDKIIEMLDKGKIPWRQPWTKSGEPSNLISGRPYRGINIILLASLGYAQNYFLSEKQAIELGATIKEDEKPHLVVFWNWQDKEAKEGEEKKKMPLLRYYMVYNVSQCIGIPTERIPEINRTVDPIELADKIVENMPNPPEISHEYSGAFYDPIEDLINIPYINSFDDKESYYSVLFHELVHSTGHGMRLARKGITEKILFGSEQYSQEEIIAELGACYLMNHSGIETEPTKNNAAYIQNWLKVLKNDRKFIVYASSFAQKAVDFVLNVEWEVKESELSNDSNDTLPLSTPTETKKKARKKSDTV
jgi:antirestriction protein ArdC